MQQQLFLAKLKITTTKNTATATETKKTFSTCCGPTLGLALFLDDVGLGRLRDEYSLDLEEEEEATLGVEAEAIEEEAVDLYIEREKNI